jgi:hypothetical protein
MYTKELRFFLLALDRFFFVVVVYLAVGAAFQFIVRRERGLKVIPNYEFWASFVMSVLVCD